MVPDQIPGDLRDRRLHWMAVVAASDADAYADLVTEGVVWVPRGGEAVMCRRAFRAWVEPLFHDFAYEFTVHPSDVIVLQDWAVERGEFISILSSHGPGSPMSHSGNYVLVWKRCEDSRWRIDRYFDVTVSLLG